MLRASSTLKEKVDEYLLRCLLGPALKDHPLFETRSVELQAGKLEELECYLYAPGEAKYTQQIAKLKVREIRKYLYEVYMDELFRLSDMETFVKDEIEGKGIIVIDEIDKLVRSPDSASSTKASDEGVQYDLLPLLDGTTVTVN